MTNINNVNGYDSLSVYYDKLMREDYAARARYLWELIGLHRPQRTPQLMLDLACGTGRLTRELAAYGCDMIGVDGSAAMLTLAAQQPAKGRPILWLCQPMQALDLYGTVDTAVCTLDSLNHLCSLRELENALKRLHYFVEPNGLFVFDVNTPYKHEHILGDRDFVLESDDVLCVWRNTYHSDTRIVDMQLDFFVPSGARWDRLTDRVRERAYALSTWRSVLQKTGFAVEAVYDDLTRRSPRPESERWVVVARRNPD